MCQPHDVLTADGEWSNEADPCVEMGDRQVWDASSVLLGVFSTSSSALSFLLAGPLGKVEKAEGRQNLVGVTTSAKVEISVH